MAKNRYRVLNHGADRRLRIETHRPARAGWGDAVRSQTTALLADDELADGPVLVASIWKVSPDNEGNLLGSKLLHGDFQWVGFALGRDKDGCVHPATKMT